MSEIQLGSLRISPPSNLSVEDEPVDWVGRGGVFFWPPRRKVLRVVFLFLQVSPRHGHCLSWWVWDEGG